MKKYIYVVLVALISLFIFWLPFILRVDSFWNLNFGGKSPLHIVANFDGLNYLAVAKTLYDPVKIDHDFMVLRSPAIYYTAHYPLYALLIRFWDTFLPGYRAVLASIVTNNIILATGVFLFFRTFLKDTKKAVLFAIVALFLPARMLSVRGVASNEPVYIFLSLTSLLMFAKGKHVPAALLGSLGVMTRSPGILLFIAYVLIFLAEYREKVFLQWKKWSPYLLMPLTLFGVWFFYGWRYGNFWAYFNSGDNIHLFFPPFQIFNFDQVWVESIWLEDVLYIFLIFTLGIVNLWKAYTKNRESSRLALAMYASVYMLPIFFIAHRDIARYSLPIAPLILLGWERVINAKEFKYVLLFLIIPIYLLGWNFILKNYQMITEWAPFI